MLGEGKGEVSGVVLDSLVVVVDSLVVVVVDSLVVLDLLLLTSLAVANTHPPAPRTTSRTSY